MNIDKVVDAIQKDAGIELAGLRESLEEMQAGLAGRVYTPEQLLARAAQNPLEASQPVLRNLPSTAPPDRCDIR
jgi:hypothetical protein